MTKRSHTCARIVEAVDVPVAGDLENGYGDRPEDAAETIRRAAAVGLAGGSIEDSPSDRKAPVYDLAHATARVEAAAAAARETATGFVLTARAENFIRGRRDLADTILRLQAYERAGADVLFAPGLPDLEAVRAVCAAVSKPVNFMAGIRGASFSVAQLQEAGVKRVSMAGSLYRAAVQGFLDAAREIRTNGTFTYVERMVTTKELTSSWVSGMRRGYFTRVSSACSAAFSGSFSNPRAIQAAAAA